MERIAPRLRSVWMNKGSAFETERAFSILVRFLRFVVPTVQTLHSTSSSNQRIQKTKAVELLQRHSAAFRMVSLSAGLLYRNTLGKISGLIDVRTASQSSVIRQKLQRHDVQNRRQVAIVLRQTNHMHAFGIFNLQSRCRRRQRHRVLRHGLAPPAYCS